MNDVAGKVLVVEDEEMVRVNLADFLTDDGFDVVSCNGGEEALERIGKDLFDVAVVDIRLPGMDGDSFIRAAHARQSTMKFLIHTGSPQFALSKELADLGIGEKHLFQKPVSDMSILSREIKKLVEEAGS